MKPTPDASAERSVWTVEKLVPGGDAMAHLADGRVAFVTGAFPGDTIRPLAVEAKKGHVRATRFELVSPGPDRVTPPCPVVEACGGCDWMAISGPAQLVHKESLLRSSLERTGGVSGLPARIPFTPSAAVLGYRSRVRFQVDADGRIGFFARGSHTVVEIPACMVCDAGVNDALVRLRRVSKDALAAFSEIEVRSAGEGPPVSILVVPRFRGGAGPSLKAVKAAVPPAWCVVARGEESASDAVQRFPLPAGAHVEAFPGVFTQVNWGVNRALVECVLDGARARGVKHFLDAYAGVGNFSLPLLMSGMTGVSVERDARAVECARRAATALGLDADGFVAGDAREKVVELARRREQFDLVVLDPPRSGAKDVLDVVARLDAPTIALCSCDPVTLSRDVATLAKRGYRIEELRGFDMFPSTHHLEAIAWITRST
ncbi:MAG TPA: RsmD family RNA methyltransferase [Polyangiaceae bacterium]|nr:RsmD family RNA methyltransferase [Polyangiaceae bacterium]